MTSLQILHFNYIDYVNNTNTYLYGMYCNVDSRLSVSIKEYDDDDDDVYFV